MASPDVPDRQKPLRRRLRQGRSAPPTGPSVGAALIGAQSFPWWLLTLAVTGGSTDLTSFVRLGSVFSGVMTGNLTLLGLAVTQRSGTVAGHIGVAIAGYAVGAMIGSVVAPAAPQENASPMLGPVFRVLLLELVCVLAFTVGWELTAAKPVAAAQYGLLVATTVAMGLQAAAARYHGPISTTYVTGLLTGAVSALVVGGWRENRISLGVLAAHTSGALVAGSLIFGLPRVLPLFPLAALAATMAILFVRRGHG